MAHYKRKKPKEYTIHTCGYRNCKQDKGKFRGNGRERYLKTLYRDSAFGDSAHPWRYKTDFWGR